MTYWFDNLTEDELVANALLLGVEFMSPADAVTNCRGYGPYWRFPCQHRRPSTINFMEAGASAI